MRNVVIGCLAAASFFVSVAQAETYICQIKLNGPARGIISDVITINMNDRTMNAMVSDAIILATNGSAVVATRSTNTPKRLSVKWALYSVKGPRNNSYGTITYGLSIWKSRGNKVSVVAKFIRHEGAEVSIPREARGTGKCELQRK